MKPILVAALLSLPSSAPVWGAVADIGGSGPCGGVAGIVASPRAALIEKRRRVVSGVVAKTGEVFGVQLRGIPPEKTRLMDDVFADELAGKIRDLDFAQLETLERVVGRTHVVGHKVVSGVHFGGAIMGRVVDAHDIGGMAIILSEAFVGHPASRLTMLHEIDHAVELILGKEFNDSSVEHFESLAASMEYRYIRRVFDRHEVGRLRDVFSGGKSELERDVDENFVGHVASAFRLDRNGYIDEHLKPYRMALIEGRIYDMMEIPGRILLCGLGLHYLISLLGGP